VAGLGALLAAPLVPGLAAGLGALLVVGLETQPEALLEASPPIGLETRPEVLPAAGARVPATPGGTAVARGRGHPVRPAVAPNLRRPG